MSSKVSKFARHLDWNLLKTFHEIADAGSITQAAHRLARKQPALSLALKRLEEHLGVTLCQRGSGGLKLTDEGQLLEELSANVVQLIGELEHRLSDTAAPVSGRLRLRMISNIVLPELDAALAAFHARYPAVQVLVDIGPVEAVGRALLRGDVDIGVASDRLRRAELAYEFLFREVHRAYCGRRFHLFGQALKSIETLGDEPFIITGIDEPTELSSYRNHHGLGRRVIGASDHLEEVRRMALLGLGIAFLPERLAAPDVEAGRLWLLGDAHPGWGVDIFVITDPKAPRRFIRRLFTEEIQRQRQASEIPTDKPR